MRLGPHTITRLRGTPGTPPYNEIDWSDPGTLDIEGCSVQPGPAQNENLIDRDAVTTLWTVWAPVDADVTERDRVTYAGTDYEVDGTIGTWSFGPLSHLVIPLKAVSG